MLPSEQKLVQEVIDRISILHDVRPDALERVEVISELREEFGAEAVGWAFRFFHALKVAEERRLAPAKEGPIWDRDLDG
jgi:hypothetical protein